MVALASTGTRLGFGCGFAFPLQCASLEYALPCERSHLQIRLHRLATNKSVNGTPNAAHFGSLRCAPAPVTSNVSHLQSMVLINLIVNLFVVAVLLLVPLGYLSLIWAAGRHAYTRLNTLGHRALIVVVSSALAIAPIAPELIGWFQFKHHCQNPIPQKRLLRPSKPESIVLQYTSTHGSDNKSPSLEIMRGIYTHFETTTVLDGVALQGHQRACEATLDCKNSLELKSKYTFTITPPQSSTQTYGSFRGLSHIQIADRTTGSIVSEAYEAVFGGGLIGFYLRVILGDWDYEYLSCGYVGGDVGAWRPINDATPREARYLAADRHFLEASFDGYH